MITQQMIEKMDRAFEERKARSEQILKRIDEASGRNDLRELADALQDLVKNTKPLVL